MLFGRNAPHAKLRIDDGGEHGQRVLHGIPNTLRMDRRIIVPIDVPSRGDLSPRNLGVRRLPVSIQMPRCLGDDLEATCHRENRLLVAYKVVV